MHLMLLAAALAGVVAIPVEAAAAPLSCRAVTALKCAPDMCTVMRLPGGFQTENGWIAGTYGTPQNLLTHDAAAGKLRICWDGECWDAVKKDAGAVAGLTVLTGTMKHRFHGPAIPATDSSFTFSFEADSTGLVYFSLAAYPKSESDYIVLRGDCLPGTVSPNFSHSVSRFAPGFWHGQIDRPIPLF